MLLMTGTGTFRIDEVLAAFRKDLMLPQDAALDPTDVVALLLATFARLERESKLWLLSSQMLRRRLQMLQKALELPLEKLGGRHFPGIFLTWPLCAMDARSFRYSGSRTPNW